MELSREDLYEAAVRAVLDLCDEAEDVPMDGLPWNPMVTTKDIRKAIKDALLVEEEPDE
jgi:hypothetical protein